MTAVLHHGPPGSFKTFSIIQRVIIPALYEGRTVVTNIRGLDCLDKIEKAMDKPLPESANIMSVPHDKEGFESMARFFHWVPFGALIVIDEVQRVYPASGGAKALDEYNLVDYQGENPDQPECVADAFDKHRHMNWDIYLSTPHITKVHKEVRTVCEWSYRHRDQSGLLPWYKNTWKEFRHDSDTTGKSASNIDLATKYKADPKIFATYKSTATGEAKKSHIKRSVIGDKRIQIIGLAMVIMFSVMAYKLSTVMERFDKKDEKSVVMDIVQSDETTVLVDDVSFAVVSDAGAESFSFNVNPFQSAKIYYTGSINERSLFVVEFNDSRFLALDNEELEMVGFKVTVIRPCFVLLEFEDIKTIHTCRPIEQPDDEQPRPSQFASR